MTKKSRSVTVLRFVTVLKFNLITNPSLIEDYLVPELVSGLNYVYRLQAKFNIISIQLIKSTVNRSFMHLVHDKSGIKRGTILRHRFGIRVSIS